jgi:hypothetical protein
MVIVTGGKSDATAGNGSCNCDTNDDAAPVCIVTIGIMDDEGCGKTIVAAESSLMGMSETAAVAVDDDDGDARINRSTAALWWCHMALALLPPAATVLVVVVCSWMAVTETPDKRVLLLLPLKLFFLTAASGSSSSSSFNLLFRDLVIGPEAEEVVEVRYCWQKSIAFCGTSGGTAVMDTDDVECRWWWWRLGWWLDAVGSDEDKDALGGRSLYETPDSASAATTAGSVICILGGGVSEEEEEDGDGEGKGWLEAEEVEDVGDEDGLLTLSCLACWIWERLFR